MGQPPWPASRVREQQLNSLLLTLLLDVAGGCRVRLIDRRTHDLGPLLAGDDFRDIAQPPDSGPFAGYPREAHRRIDLGAHGAFGEVVLRQFLGRNREQLALPRCAPVDEDPRDNWDTYTSLADAVGASGQGSVAYAAPFLPTIVGTDTYTDELW